MTTKIENFLERIADDYTTHNDYGRSHDNYYAQYEVNSPLIEGDVPYDARVLLEELKSKKVFTQEEVFQLTLEAVDLGMQLRQDQLKGWEGKSGKELHQEWFNKKPTNKLNTDGQNSKTKNMESKRYSEGFRAAQKAIVGGNDPQDLWMQSEGSLEHDDFDKGWQEACRQAGATDPY